MFVEQRLADLRIEAIPQIPYASSTYLNRRTGDCLAIADADLDEIGAKLSQNFVFARSFTVGDCGLEQRRSDQKHDGFADLFEGAEHVAGLPSDLSDGNPGRDDAGNREQ